MDWKVLASTFLVVFLAELGDKTQLATLGLAAGSESRISVFVGAAFALVAASAIAVREGPICHLPFAGHLFSPTTLRAAVRSSSRQPAVFGSSSRSPTI